MVLSAADAPFTLENRMLLFLLSMSLLSASPAEVESTSAAVIDAEPTWGAWVSLGTSGNFSTPSAQLTFERRLASRLTVELGGTGSYFEGFGFRTESVQLMTGARFYLTKAFRGLWVGGRVELGWQGSQSTGGLAAGLGGLGLLGGASRGAQGAVVALLGYTFRWDNGAMLSISGGPQVSHVFGTAQLASSTTVGLQTFAGLGIAF